MVQSTGQGAWQAILRHELGHFVSLLREGRARERYKLDDEPMSVVVRTDVKLKSAFAVQGLFLAWRHREGRCP
jgi:hypothetical protein